MPPFSKIQITGETSTLFVLDKTGLTGYLQSYLLCASPTTVKLVKFNIRSPDRRMYIYFREITCALSLQRKFVSIGKA